MSKRNHLHDQFGSVLKSVRLERGLSQEQLAFECGLDRTFISLMERGQRQPTLESIFKLAEALDMKPSKLMVMVEKSYFNK